jgi:hypothetical protein
MTKIKLDLSNSWKDIIVIEKAEKHFNAKFVCETPLREGDGWRDYSSLIFYNEEKHPQGSNYLAISYVFGVDGEVDLILTDGISATTEDIIGIIDGDEVIYSRSRHDYRVGKTEVMIDGGRDYTRSSISDPNQYVTLRILKGKLEIVK